MDVDRNAALGDLLSDVRRLVLWRSSLGDALLRRTALRRVHQSRGGRNDTRSTVTRLSDEVPEKDLLAHGRLLGGVRRAATDLRRAHGPIETVGRNLD